MIDYEIVTDFYEYEPEINDIIKYKKGKIKYKICSHINNTSPYYKNEWVSISNIKTRMTKHIRKNELIAKCIKVD